MRVEELFGETCGIVLRFAALEGLDAVNPVFFGVRGWKLRYLRNMYIF